MNTNVMNIVATIVAVVIAITILINSNYYKAARRARLLRNLDGVNVKLRELEEERETRSRVRYDDDLTDRLQALYVRQQKLTRKIESIAV